MRQLVAPQTLFIVEQVHASPELAQILITEWLEYPNRSRLLLIGNPVLLEGGGACLEEFLQDSTRLEIDLDDIAGVFQSLMARLGHVNYATPPRWALQLWRDSFAADLATFCMQVKLQAGSLGSSGWQLKVAVDGRRFWEVFLKPAEEEERRALVQLAALSLHGVSLPATLIPERVFRNSLAVGLVVRTEHGRQRHEHWELSHPSLARAIIDSSGTLCDYRLPLEEIARQDPFTATALAREFERDGDINAARSMLNHVLRSPGWLSAIIGAGLQYCRVIVKRCVRLRLLTWSEIDECMLLEEEPLLNALTHAPPVLLVEFLQFCRESLARTNERLASVLAVPANARDLAEHLLEYPLAEYAGLVSSLSGSHPALADELAASLAADAARDRVEQRGLEDSLGLTLSFLKQAPGLFPAVVS